MGELEELLQARFPGLEALPQFVEVAFLDIKVDAFTVVVVLRLADYDVEDAFEPVADYVGDWAEPDMDPRGWIKSATSGWRLIISISMQTR